MAQRRTRASKGRAKRAVIFDFDGTIADSFEYVLAFLLAEAKNTTPFTPAQKKQLRKMSMGRLTLHLGIPFWRGPLVYFKGRRVMRAHMEQVQPFPGVVEAIRQLHADGWRLFIATSNSRHNVRQLLRRYDIEQCFTAVRGGAGVTGKAPMIRQLLMRYRLPRMSTWYVGDETGDVVAAARAGVRCLAVGWGFADPADLKTMEPTAYVQRAADIPKVLEAWKK